MSHEYVFQERCWNIIGWCGSVSWALGQKKRKVEGQWGQQLYEKQQSHCMLAYAVVCRVLECHCIMRVGLFQLYLHETLGSAMMSAYAMWLIVISPHLEHYKGGGERRDSAETENTVEGVSEEMKVTKGSVVALVTCCAYVTRVLHVTLPCSDLSYLTKEQEHTWQ